MALGATSSSVEPQNYPEQGHGIHPFFLVYGVEAIRPTDLEYGSPRVRGYDEGTNQ
jgi:hypothetical protein